MLLQVVKVLVSDRPREVNRVNASCGIRQLFDNFTHTLVGIICVIGYFLLVKEPSVS